MFPHSLAPSRSPSNGALSFSFSFLALLQVAEGGTIDLKMRVFVVNSEDAKAVGEYIKAHPDQIPAPFVVLAHHLPMSVLYNPKILDLSDGSVADRLRKQVATLHCVCACMCVYVCVCVCARGLPSPLHCLRFAQHINPKP